MELNTELHSKQFLFLIRYVFYLRSYFVWSEAFFAQLDVLQIKINLESHGCIFLLFCVIEWLWNKNKKPILLIVILNQRKTWWSVSNFRGSLGNVLCVSYKEILQRISRLNLNSINDCCSLLAKKGNRIYWSITCKGIWVNTTLLGDGNRNSICHL